MITGGENMFGKVKGKMIVSLVMVLAFALVLGGSGVATAADYPDKPIELIVPFGAGGGSDTFARFYARLLSDELGTEVNVVNVPGGGGVTGMVEAFRRPADGYTILSISPSHTIAEVFKKHPEVQITEDFEPLARIQQDNTLWSVSAKRGRFDTIEELIAHEKENPGSVTMGGTTPGGFTDIELAIFNHEAGTNIRFVPYDSGAEAKAATMGGEIDIVCEDPMVVVELTRAGELKPLVAFTEERLTGIEVFADVPTAREIGYDVVSGTTRGLVVKKGTPQEYKDILVDAIKKVYDSDAYQEFEEKNLLHLREGWLGPVEYEEYLENLRDQYITVLKEVGRL
jgi:tripartite-type tricarboxylate transporter receptor subunit TctC